MYETIMAWFKEFRVHFFLLDVPMSGTASDVVGIDSATKFKNTVNDRRIVTPAMDFLHNLFFREPSSLRQFGLWFFFH
jgi:hypothetical protein